MIEAYLALRLREAWLVLLDRAVAWGWVIVALAAGWCVIMALYERYRKD